MVDYLVRVSGVFGGRNLGSVEDMELRILEKLGEEMKAAEQFFADAIDIDILSGCLSTS